MSEQHSSTPLEEVSTVAPDVASSSVEADPTVGASSSGGKEPFGVSQVVTPSGIEIYYQAGPKRLYRLRDTTGSGLNPGNGDWFDVPSMSDILSILDKPGLPWWGMKVGVEGVLTLWDNGDLPNRSASSVDEVVDLLTKHKLTVNHVRDKAGDRGQDIHDALEVWANHGILPNPAVFGPDKAGYITGLRQFIIDSKADPVRSEVMVGSLEWEFAGRFDIGAEIPRGARVVTKSYPKRKPIVEQIHAGGWMLDLKTSKGVYESHHIQLAGYNVGLEECYGHRYEHTGIVHVFPDGRYELVVGKAADDDFFNVKAAHWTMQRLK